MKHSRKNVFILRFLGVPYLLSSGEDYENNTSIKLYEAIDPNGVSYWLCDTSLMFVVQEKKQ
jgi:hypothetical protein